MTAASFTDSPLLRLRQIQNVQGFGPGGHGYRLCASPGEVLALNYLRTLRVSDRSNETSLELALDCLTMTVTTLSP